MTYLWSEFSNPLGYWLIHHNFHFASIFLFGDGKLQVIFWQESGAAFHHPDPTVHADEGGAGQAQEEQQQGFLPTPAQRAHADRSQLFPSTGEIPSTKESFCASSGGVSSWSKGQGKGSRQSAPRS